MDEKKSEGFYFHVSSTKLCLTFEFPLRFTSIKSCQIALKGLELPRKTLAVIRQVSSIVSDTPRIQRRKRQKDRQRESSCEMVRWLFLVRDSPRETHCLPVSWEEMERTKHSKAKGHVLPLTWANVYGVHHEAGTVLGPLLI